MGVREFRKLARQSHIFRILEMGFIVPPREEVIDQASAFDACLEVFWSALTDTRFLAEFVDFL